MRGDPISLLSLSSKKHRFLRTPTRIAKRVSPRTKNGCLWVEAQSERRRPLIKEEEQQQQQSSKKKKEKLANFSIVTNEMTMMDLAQDVTNNQMTNI